jgi:hypothetical protein
VLVDILLVRDLLCGRRHCFTVQKIVVVFAGLAIMEGNIVRSAVTVTTLVADEDVALLAVVDLSGFAFRSNASTKTKFFGQFLGEQIVVARGRVSF